jgi:membrane protease YdiL (CAAX protease family)
VLALHRADLSRSPKVARLVLVLLWAFPRQLLSPFLVALPPDPALHLLLDLLIYALPGIGLLVLALRRGLTDLPGLGLHTRVAGRRRPVELLILVVGLPPLLWVGWHYCQRIAAFAFPTSAPMIPGAGDAMLPTAGWPRELAIIYASGSAGWFEEIYLRALLWQAFPHRWWTAPAYVISSGILFGAMHWEGGLRHVADASLFGAMLALLLLWGGNLWPLVFGHAFVDMVGLHDVH